MRAIPATSRASRATRSTAVCLRSRWSTPTTGCTRSSSATRWRARRAAAPAPAPVPAAAPAAATEPAKAPASDAPYIETPRCTTCEECVKINPRLFVYDANKQAYLADLKAGSYKDLVEAAESCQVSIIHPGKSLNPDEPGLAELIERAQPFL